MSKVDVAKSVRHSYGAEQSVFLRAYNARVC